MNDDSGLTRNETLVLGALRRESRPQSAYQLLDGLRGDGLRAPPQVYRALKTLSERGLVHKLESRNAFLPCAHAHCHPGHGTPHAVIFLVCEHCERVEEVADAAVDADLAKLAAARSFAMSAGVVEMLGRCRDCGRTAAS